jgi:hypothetical protein
LSLSKFENFGFSFERGIGSNMHPITYLMGVRKTHHSLFMFMHLLHRDSINPFIYICIQCIKTWGDGLIERDNLDFNLSLISLDFFCILNF